MHITTCVKEFDLTPKFQEIAGSAKATVSFLGSRCIQVQGYEGTTSIDSLAEAVIALANAKNFEFTPEERRIGEQIATQITRLYSDSNTVVENSNFLTRMCCAVRELFFHLRCPFFPSGSSWIHVLWGDSYEGGYLEFFDYYTPKQFLEKHGREPEEHEMEHPFLPYNYLYAGALARFRGN